MLYKKTVVNQALPSLHEGSLEIQRKVLLRIKKLADLQPGPFVEVSLE